MRTETEHQRREREFEAWRIKRQRWHLAFLLLASVALAVVAMLLSR